MLGAGDAERVAELMRETAAAELLPRFRNLSKDDVRQKRPGDIVTVADVAAEQRLASGLAKILPGVPVVGEEAVEKDAGLLDLIGRPGEAAMVARKIIETLATPIAYNEHPCQVGASIGIAVFPDDGNTMEEVS